MILISCAAPRRMPFRTLRVLLATQSVETCIPTLERRNDDLNIVRRCASHAFPDALRPHGDAERRDLHSHAGACGTMILISCGAARRMPFRTLRVLLATQSVEHCIPTLERRNDDLNIVRRSASHAFPDAPRPPGDAERRNLHSHAGA
ncbi:hypothetical protein AL065_17985 [Pseudomonas amygdali pv. ulmi]|nr:hypothetical protein AL065_17985 [Pseudomonas amygdali pv. ulmi]